MFGLFKRLRENGAANHNNGAPRLSADLKALQDRDFAERLNQRLIEKQRAIGGGKVEPKFKTVAAPKAAPTAQPPSPPRTDAGRAPNQSTPSAEPARVEPRMKPFIGASVEPVVTKRDPAHSPAKPAPAAPAAPAAPPVPVARIALTDTDERPPAIPQAAPSLPVVMRAAQFAAERHKSQRRRGAAREPYVNHLLEVAALLAAATDGRDPDLVVAGLLHDLIEDQGVSADDIARQFGVAVAALVLEVTTDKSLPETERGRLQIAHAAHKSPRARMLRIADLVSNLRALRQSPPADWSVERQREYFRWAHDMVAAGRGLSPRLDAAFDEAYAAGPVAPSTAAE